jgi:uncharacterized membrane protein YdjX (TVP38/TMEM64 family)
VPKRYHSLIGIVIVVVFAIISLIFFRRHLSEIDQFLKTIGWWGPLVVICIYPILALTPVPNDPLTIMVGALYGPIWGLVISTLGNTSAAILEYAIANQLGNLARFDEQRQKLPWGLNKMPVDSFWFLTLGRAVPGFGSKVVSILAGLYHVPFGKYLYTTILMSFLGAIGYVLGGYFFVHT